LQFDYQPLLLMAKAQAQQPIWHKVDQQLSINGQLDRIKLYKLIPTKHGLAIDIGITGQMNAQFDLILEKTL